MKMEDTLDRICACGLVAVIRGIEPEALGPTVKAILHGGVDCIEIAMSVRGALKQMTLLKEKWGEEVILGAGEVLNGEMVTLATTAQADFCSGIGANLEMIRTSIERDALPIPGALTPTEIQSAWHAGASMVKLFPVQVLSADYIRIMRRTLYRVDLLPSGGVTPQNAAEFVRAGAHCVAAGQAIVDVSAAAKGEFDTISRNAEVMRQVVHSARA